MTIETILKEIRRNDGFIIVERIQDEEDNFRFSRWLPDYDQAISTMRRMSHIFELDLDKADLISVVTGRFMSWIIK